MGFSDGATELHYCYGINEVALRAELSPLPRIPSSGIFMV